MTRASSAPRSWVLAAALARCAKACAAHAAAARATVTAASEASARLPGSLYR